MSILIIGIGNEYRNDDGVGLLVARKIQEAQIPGIIIREQSGEGAALIEAWKGYEKVLLVDAVSSGAEPGTIRRIDATAQKVPTKFFHYSTHAFSVAEAVELARTLNEIPKNLVIYGIEGENFTSGNIITPALQKAALKLSQQIISEIKMNSGEVCQKL